MWVEQYKDIHNLEHWEISRGSEKCTKKDGKNWTNNGRRPPNIKCLAIVDSCYNNL